MVTSLFTSRIVLGILGETDYGIYNIVGGVVVLFSFLNSALLSATQRYLNYSLGEHSGDPHKVFCMSMNSYLILSFFIIILGETIGLWFVNTQLNIPETRMPAANWVYQMTLLTFILNLLRVPYNATIIAYERMNVYAYISLIEVALKLGVVYLLYITIYDKLVIYSILYMLVPLLITWIYKIYCQHIFSIAHYEFLWDWKMFKALFSFSGWSLFGGLANLAASQGLNILVNIFHGVTLNAALGLANQVSSSVMGFVSNFQIAFNPQIVKLYASQKLDQLYNLIFRASKVSYFLLFIIALPIMLNVDLILSIWLKDVPKYTGIFIQLILINFLLDALIAPLWMFVQATGHIRNYQLLVSFIIFINFPLIYLTLKLGMPVYYVWIVRILVNVILAIVRCIYVKRTYKFPIKEFFFRVIIPVSLVTCIAVPSAIIVHYAINISWLQFTVSVIFSVSITLIAIWWLGIEKDERYSIKTMIVSLFHKN